MLAVITRTPTRVGELTALAARYRSRPTDADAHALAAAVPMVLAAMAAQRARTPAAPRSPRQDIAAARAQARNLRARHRRARARWADRLAEARFTARMATRRADRAERDLDRLRAKLVEQAPHRARRPDRGWYLTEQAEDLLARDRADRSSAAVRERTEP